MPGHNLLLIGNAIPVVPGHNLLLLGHAIPVVPGHNFVATGFGLTLMNSTVRVHAYVCTPVHASVRMCACAHARVYPCNRSTQCVQGHA